MTLSADLRALGPVVGPLEAQHGEPDAPAAWLCPRLRTTYSPRASWAEWREATAEREPSLPKWSRVWDPGPPAPGLGSSLAPNSKRPPRYGLGGLTPAGRKSVWRALALLEEMRPLLSFWTVSLPTESMHDLNRADGLPFFQDRLRKELARLLQARGIPALVVGVAELQPARSHASGIPCPHWHVVFQGRKDRRSRWALSKADLDGVIAAALASAGVPVPDLRSAGNVQQVKKSVRAYLSKYMTKGSGDCARFVGRSHENLIPRQWWFWTKALRRWVLQHILPVRFELLCWMHENRRQLQELELVRFRVLDLPDPRAPMTFEVNWMSCAAVAQVLALFIEEEWDSQWWRQQRIRGAVLAGLISG